MGSSGLSRKALVNNRSRQRSYYSLGDRDKFTLTFGFLPFEAKEGAHVR